MKKKHKTVLSLALGTAALTSLILASPGQTANAAGSSYQQTIEFEDAASFEPNDSNKIESSQFANYSGSGYLYLTSGWGDVSFSVPHDGEYNITIASNADSYKENFLYLDESDAGKLTTDGNGWQEYTNTYYLSEGTHKFGVSADWGYTALDYIKVESVSVIEPEAPDETVETDETIETVETDDQQPVEQQNSDNSRQSGSRYEFEHANRFEQNGKNRIDSTLFSGYSGSGYVYLESGWGEVQFNVPSAGRYRLTIVTNADTYKENYLYLDDNSAGTLRTSGNRWESYTQTVYLSAGTHKYGVSTGWGYTALDYVVVEPEGGQTPPTDPVKPSGKGMYVSNGRLYNANGKEFVMRGVNVAHAWYPGETQTSINAIADRGANCVRVVLADGTQWGKTPRSEVERIISWCEARGLVCILEVHDHTGFDDVNRLNTAVNYWLEIKDLLNAHQNYVIVNIANEWLGTWNNSSTWTSAYQSAIRTLRNAGIGNVLMVDTSGYGQETSTCINNSRSVVSADSTGNTMISIHMYSVAGKDAQTVTNNINSMLSTGVCFCIGEFGDWQNGGDVDETTIMRLCTDKNIGYAAWSWKGNGGIDTSLDMANDWQGTSLTNWGNYVFYADGIGIRDTARSAY